MFKLPSYKENKELREFDVFNTRELDLLFGAGSIQVLILIDQKNHVTRALLRI